MEEWTAVPPAEEYTTWAQILSACIIFIMFSHISPALSIAFVTYTTVGLIAEGRTTPDYALSMTGFYLLTPTVPAIISFLAQVGPLLPEAMRGIPQLAMLTLGVLSGVYLLILTLLRRVGRFVSEYTPEAEALPTMLNAGSVLTGGAILIYSAWQVNQLRKPSLYISVTGAPALVLNLFTGWFVSGTVFVETITLVWLFIAALALGYLADSAIHISEGFSRAKGMFDRNQEHEPTE